MSQKVRFAIIGCGRMGLGRARTIIDYPEAELVCVVDNDGGIAKRNRELVEARFSIPAWVNRIVEVYEKALR